MFEFTTEQELLLTRIKERYPESDLWYLWIGPKIGALIDIYAGCHPDIFQKNESLANEYRNKLITYCDEYNRMFPQLRQPLSCNEANEITLENTNNTVINKKCETVIIGAGIAGLLAALQLARQEKNITLLSDRSPSEYIRPQIVNLNSNICEIFKKALSHDHSLVEQFNDLINKKTWALEGLIIYGYSIQAEQKDHIAFQIKDIERILFKGTQSFKNITLIQLNKNSIMHSLHEGENNQLIIQQKDKENLVIPFDILFLATGAKDNPNIHLIQSDQQFIKKTAKQWAISRFEMDRDKVLDDKVEPSFEHNGNLLENLAFFSKVSKDKIKYFIYSYQDIPLDSSTAKQILKAKLAELLGVPESYIYDYKNENNEKQKLALQLFSSQEKISKMSYCVGNTGLIIKIGDALLRSCPSKGKGIHYLTEEIELAKNILTNYIPSPKNAQKISEEMQSQYLDILSDYNANDFEEFTQDLQL